MALFFEWIDSTNIYYDNHSCINLFENLVFDGRSKHIDIRHHFIKDCVQHGLIQEQYVHIDQKVAYILKKALGKEKFVYFTGTLGVVENTFLSKREC